MLEKPDLQEDKLIDCLRDEYGLAASQVTFLPLGADINTAVYRAVSGDHTPYFVKLRRGRFDETSVTLPKFLSDQGIGQIMAPLSTKAGRLWSDLDSFKCILYPYVEGRDAYELPLSDGHWAEFGSALRRFHAADLPSAIVSQVKQESYAPHSRQIVSSFLLRVETERFVDPVAARLALFMKANRDEILDLLNRADRLALRLQAHSPPHIVCHSDLHAGNFLIGANGDFYIVDWDDPILAPKERDLMYVGGGLIGRWRTPAEEEALFYRAYGPAQPDPIAQAYYRYERIIRDIAEYCQQLLLTDEGGADREQSFQYLTSDFLPGGLIEITRQTDKSGIL